MRYFQKDITPERVSFQVKDFTLGYTITRGSVISRGYIIP